MPDSVRVLVRGGSEVRKALTAMDLRVDAATVAALKAMQKEAKKNIRSRMRGRPRWDHRGASARTGESVDLNLSPHHVEKSGGPGRLTGMLSRHVGGLRRVKKRGPAWVGGVGVGGGVTTLYRGKVEERYPFFKPGVEKTEEKAAADLWAAEYEKALRR